MKQASLLSYSNSLRYGCWGNCRSQATPTFFMQDKDKTRLFRRFTAWKLFQSHATFPTQTHKRTGKEENKTKLSTLFMPVPFFLARHTVGGCQFLKASTVITYRNRAMLDIYKYAIVGCIYLRWGTHSSRKHSDSKLSSRLIQAPTMNACTGNLKVSLE